MVAAKRAVPLIASFGLQVSLTSIIGAFAIALTLNQFPAFGFSLAAIAANLLNLGFSFWIVLWGLWKPDSPLSKLLEGKKGVFGLGISPLVAFVITIVFLLTMQFQVETPEGERSLLGDAAYGLLYSAWAVFSASTIANLILFIVVKLDKPPAVDKPELVARYTLRQISPTGSFFSPPSIQGVGITMASQSDHTQSRRGSSVFTEGQEYHCSITPYGPRAVTSRTRLATSPCLTETSDSSPESYELTPMSTPVSGPSPLSARHLVARSNNVTATQLESIPGSAGNSPAKPLGWPFNNKATDGKERTSDKSKFVLHEGRGPPKFGKRVYSPVTPPCKAVLDESHIHPLFRSDSPAPPPTPSPATTVVASALGGKYITPDALAQVRALSNASSAASLPSSAFPSRKNTRRGEQRASGMESGSPILVKSKSFANDESNTHT